MNYFRAPNFLFMKKIFLLFSFFSLFVFSASAQKVYKTFGQKCAAVRIIDPGALFSTYVFSAEDSTEMLRQIKSSELIADIDAHHTEEGWEGNMKKLDSRVSPEGQAAIMNYHAFIVCKIPGRVVLVIPASQNKNAADGYAPTHDFYIVISNTVVRK